jgi:hypothetical protein
MSLESVSQLQCFLIEPSQQANSFIIETIDQKTSVRTQKSSNSPGKCYNYKPISYSIDIQCCIIGHWLLLAKRIICFSSHDGRDMRHFYRIRLDIPTSFGLYKCDEYLSYSGIPLVYAFLSIVIVICLKPWHMSVNTWIKSETWQSPPTRGTLLDHIWSKSVTWQSPPTRGTFLDHTWSKSVTWQSPPTRGTFFGPHLVEVRDVTKSSNEGHIFRPCLVKVRDVTKSSNEGHICWAISGQSLWRDKVLRQGAHFWTTFGQSPWRDKVLQWGAFFLDHIWSESSTWQSPPTRDIFFWTIFGTSPWRDKVLRQGAYLFLVEPYLVDVQDMAFLPIAWQDLSNEELYLFNVSTTLFTFLFNWFLVW